MGSALTLRAGFGSASRNAQTGSCRSQARVPGRVLSPHQVNPQVWFRLCSKPIQHSQPSPTVLQAPSASHHLQNPPHQDSLRLLSYQQQTTNISTASPMVRRQNPATQIINHPANMPYPATSPKHAAQGSSGTLPAI